MATQVHIEHIDDTEANIRANMDLSQIGIFTDQDEEFVWMNDDASKLKYGAIQKHWTGAAFVYEDNDFGEVTLHDDLLLPEYIKHVGDTTTHIRFQTEDIGIIAGGSTVLNCQDDRAWFSQDCGFGTASPGAPVHVNGGDIHLTNSASDPAIYIGDSITAGNYGQVQWDSGDDYIALGTNTGGNTLQVYETGFVTIGSIVAPDGTLHVHSGSAGVITASSAANILVLEAATSNGMTFFTPDASQSAIVFGSPTDNVGASIVYKQSTALFTIGSHISDGQTVFNAGDGVEAARFDANGNMGIGITPEDWDAGYDTLQINTNGVVSGDASSLWLATNAYVNTSTWKFINTGNTSRIQMAQGSIQFETDISGGSADGTISYDSLLLLSTGGATFNNDGIDLDFRVESDADTHALFVEGSSGNIGMGKVPSHKLDIELATDDFAIEDADADSANIGPLTGYVDIVVGSADLRLAAYSREA